jgi:hypothetical protein
VKRQLASLVEGQRRDYDAHFSHVKHQITLAPPSAALRLHYVRTDANGEPRFQELARLLARYITLYCFTAEKRKNLSQQDQNEMFMQARDLFRRAARSGQAGELLVYFLLETVLGAPQAIKKMAMTTNPKDERKGSDGVHLLWDDERDVLEVIFAESKIWKSFSDALRGAFESIDEFHSGRTKRHEINVVTSSYSSLNPKLQAAVKSYIEEENVSKCRFAQACLIGFEWEEYKCLRDSRREKFIVEFERRYLQWATKATNSINEKLGAFRHKHLRFEFFLLPFSNVEAFRLWFEQELTGKS